MNEFIGRILMALSVCFQKLVDGSHGAMDLLLNIMDNYELTIACTERSTALSLSNVSEYVLCVKIVSCHLVPELVEGEKSSGTINEIVLLSYHLTNPGTLIAIVHLSCPSRSSGAKIEYVLSAHANKLKGLKG